MVFLYNTMYEGEYCSWWAVEDDDDCDQGYPEGGGYGLGPGLRGWIDGEVDDM